MSALGSDLTATLRAAEAGSSTTGGWPERLPAEQQEAWMAMVEAEALLVGLARTRLAGGGVDQLQVGEAVRCLRELVLQQWPVAEVECWRRVAELLSDR